VLVAPDKFKGTLSSAAAAHAIERGVRRAWPKARVTRCVLTDGGEGFMELLVRQTGGVFRRLTTTDAIGRPCRARWGMLGNGRTAVIGLTSASGLAQIPLERRNPELTSNAGTGRLIAAALRSGAREILVGLGGSATTEGGISLATAIGFRFLDAQGHDIPPNGAGLRRLERILPPECRPKARFIVATDVDNPLYGSLGAARQFARQKGADAAMIARLETGLRRLAKIVKRDLGKDCANEPGAGSAGGCGYGLMAFFDARRENGFELVRRYAHLDRLVRQHDLVITGEGSLDRTSLLGKAPVQLAALARHWHRPTWALCGRAVLPRHRSPFVRIAALSTPALPGPPPESLSPAEHAQRLEDLAYAQCLSAQPI
jgi:glycerate kinase